MNDFLKKHYGEVEGPLGYPMPEQAAKELDAVLAAHPDHDYSRQVLAKGTTEVMPGAREDIAWITTEDVDLVREVVLSSGMDDSLYKLNPVVTLNHSYYSPPVGRSLWRRKIRDGATRGIKAKTHYPPRPESWDQESWPADSVFALIQAQLLVGKSIGFITIESHAPTEEEVRKNPEWAGVRRIITKWKLLEYAVCSQPCNMAAVTEEVSKGRVDRIHCKAVGLEIPEPPPPPAPVVVPHTTLSEIEKAFSARVNDLDLSEIARKAFADALDKARGRV